jgi:PH (Pleckstrin Homology) domain-containing protein
MTANQPPDKPQVFRSPTAVVVWIVWLLFAVGNWIDLAARGQDHASAVAAAILLLATGAAYVTAQRPRIIADKTGVTIRNPLRDHRIGWAGVVKVDLADLLRVHCRWAGPADAASGQPGGKEHHKVISAWAVHYSRRRQLAAEARARRAARSPGLRRSSLGLPSGGRGLLYGGVSGPETSSPEAEAEKVVRVLSERATAALDAADWPSGSEPLTSTWSGRAIAALVIPALILLLAWLL